ncbi:MAG: helix-turn-helix transcriptional regulator [Nitrospirota bacterium]
MGDIKERLRKLMEIHNISHWQLAKLINVEAETVLRWLREPFPSISEDNLRKLAKFFGVHKAYLKYGIDDELISFSLELQRYDPETYVSMKEIIRIILDVSQEKRKQKYIEEYNKYRQIRETGLSIKISTLTEEHDRLLKEIVKNVTRGKMSTFSARSENKKDIEEFGRVLELLRYLRELGYIKLPEINMRLNDFGKIIEAGPCELTFKGEGLIEYLTEK